MASEEKLDFKKVFPIFVIILVDLLGLTIIIPLLPLYATSFGANAAVIGLLGATYPLMQFIGAPLLGSLSDRYGRKPVLIISQIGTLIGFILLGVAQVLPLLFLSRFIDGLSGANIATAQAAITDSTTEKTRTQGLGLLGAAFGIGFIIGPLITVFALVASHDNYHVPAFIAAGCSLTSILMTTFWLEETLPAEKRQSASTQSHSLLPLQQMKAALLMPQVGILLVLLFVQQVAFGGFEQLLALFTLSRLGLNGRGNAAIFVFVGLLIVMVQGKYIGVWSRRFGERKLIYMGLVGLAIGLILTALTPHVPVDWYSKNDVQAELQDEAHHNASQDEGIKLPDETNKGWLGLLWILAAMIPASIGGAVLHPSINSLITQSVPSDKIGGILGVSAAFFSGANVVAPLLGGVIFEGVGASAPFIAGGVVLLLVFGVAWRAIKPLPVTQPAVA